MDKLFYVLSPKIKNGKKQNHQDVKDNYIISTTETASGMRKSLPKLAALALKLAKKEEIKAARFEGYLPTGHRYNEYHEKTGARRVTDILLDKLYNRPYKTEVPLRGFEQVPPAAKIENLKDTKIALFTTGGLVDRKSTRLNSSH